MARLIAERSRVNRTTTITSPTNKNGVVGRDINVSTQCYSKKKFQPIGCRCEKKWHQTWLRL